MLMSANVALPRELNNVQHYSNFPHPYQHQAYQIETDYRKSMPELQYIMVSSSSSTSIPIKHCTQEALNTLVTHYLTHRTKNGCPLLLQQSLCEHNFIRIT